METPIFNCKPAGVRSLSVICPFVRAGGRRGGSGADLRCNTGGKPPVDNETKCRGGKHGEK